MLAALTFDRDPLEINALPGIIIYWVQAVGGIAAFLIAIWLLLVLIRVVPIRKVSGESSFNWLFILFATISFAIYLLIGTVRLPETLSAAGIDSRSRISAGWRNLESQLFTTAGASAILAAFVPLLMQFPWYRSRRIGAIAGLSFKEALRRRVPFIFALVLLIFLFGNWYVTSKPEDQVRTYVSLTFEAMGPLLILAAIILGAFSLPADFKNQTIHTVVTKPVYRFEIVLGRFLGFVALLTLILLVMTGLSLLYVLRNVDPAAASESLKARSPAYGELSFENTQSGETSRAENVGREWSYRSYINKVVPGKTAQQAAIWKYSSLPSELANRKLVRCEFTFDIYRLTKGKENEGLGCDFLFTSSNYKKGNEELGAKRRDALKLAGKSQEEIDNTIAEELGYFQVKSKDITDYHTQWIDVPGGLFRNLKPSSDATPNSGSQNVPIQVRVINNSDAGAIGMARYDFYFRLDEEGGANETLLFAINFFKASLGILCQVVLVCALATALSTYFSGVISFLITSVFYVSGMFHEFIQSVAEGKNAGGGPMESFYRLATRGTSATPLDQGTISTIATNSDVVYRWLIGKLQIVLPDVDRFYLNNYVAEGFNLPLEQIGMTILLLVGYLLPWGLLAYYLIRWREIASQT